MAYLVFWLAYFFLAMAGFSFWMVYIYVHVLHEMENLVFESMYLEISSQNYEDLYLYFWSLLKAISFAFSVEKVC